MSSSSSSAASSASDDDWDKYKDEAKKKKPLKSTSKPKKSPEKRKTKASTEKSASKNKGATSTVRADKKHKRAETEKKSSKIKMDQSGDDGGDVKKSKKSKKLKRDEDIRSECLSDSDDDEQKQVAKKDKKKDKAKANVTKLKVSKKKKAESNGSAENNNNDDGDDEEDDLSVKSDKSRTELKTKKEPKYQKKTQLEHILLRPDTYVGSVESEVEPYWVAMPENDSGPRMEYRKVNIVPGLYKIFDEILVNAADNKQRDEPGKKGVCMTRLEVNIDATAGSITVRNDGKGISVAQHDDYPMCIPQLIFGELLTSSNYDDDVKQTVGGRNGFGAKLANIFSRKFVVEIEDATAHKSYRQVWRDNMSKVDPPVISAYSGKKNSTSITFWPELGRFGMESFDSDILSLLRKRVYDIAGTTPDSLKVFLNGTQLTVPNFKNYAALYIGDPDTPSLEDEPPRPRVYAAMDRRWEVCVSLSDTDQFAQVSFVNNIATARGGTHVAYMSDIISKAIVELIGKTKGASKSAKELSAADVKKHLFLFVNALVVNPTFDSQTKTFLTTKKADLDQLIDPVTKHVSKVKVDTLEKWKAFILSIKKSGLVQEIITRATEKAEKKMAKTDGKLKSGKRITGIPKLEDANLAGTKDGHLCTLILTEGDSAKALAVSGLAVVGRDKYGVFPLKGKMLNVREASASQMMANSEVTALKQILGLQSGKKYTSTKELRYGRVMIMADQDHVAYIFIHHNEDSALCNDTDSAVTSYDLLHDYPNCDIHRDGRIKNHRLVINLFAHCWPSLLQVTDPSTGSFLWEFITPIVRVSKGYSESGAALNKHAKELLFYSMPDYEDWSKKQGVGEASTSSNAVAGSTKGWNIKYYKGLGTSTSTEAKAYFSDLGRHQIEFAWDDTSAEKLALAFSAKAADARKDWLGKYEPSQGGIDQSGFGQRIQYSTFVDKELILFSMASNQRAIPSLIDGLKPGQRKILHCAFKRNLRREVKVAQLAGYVSEHSAYHHGEQSLCSTIVGMAQNFVGNNNVNLLLPNGQFGTRLQGGKDAASARYIFTTLSPVTRAAFPACDDALLSYLLDDGQSVEPEWFIPVLPLVLVNGSAGIGTGWSSDVPNYNPRAIVGQIKKMIEIQKDITGDKDVTSAELTAPAATMDAKLEAAFISQLSELMPWYKGFRGIIKFKSVGRFVVKGVLERLGPNTLHISELPLHTWTGDYKATVLETLLAAGDIKEFREYHTDTTVSFVVEFTPEQMAAMESEGAGGLYRKLKLNSSLATTNMVLFSRDGHLKRFGSPNEILRDFFSVRMEFYHRRKAALIEASRKEQDKLANKVRFIRAVCGLSEETMHVMNKAKKNIVAQLDKGKYLRIPKRKEKENNSTAEEDVAASADVDDEDDEYAGSSSAAASSSAKPRASDFDYLMTMDIWALTKEKAAALAAELAASQAALRVLELTLPSQMWLDDLDVFEQALDKQEQEEKQMEEDAAEKSRLKRLKANASGGGSSKKAKLAAAAAAIIKGEVIVDTSDDFDETKVKVVRKRKNAATAITGEEAITNDADGSKQPSRKKQKVKTSKKRDGNDNMTDDGPCPMDIDDNESATAGKKKKKSKQVKPVKEEKEVIIPRVRLPRATTLKETKYTEEILSDEENGDDSKSVDNSDVENGDDEPMRAFSGVIVDSDDEAEEKKSDKIDTAGDISCSDPHDELASKRHESIKSKASKKGIKRKAKNAVDSDDSDSEERSDSRKDVKSDKNKKRRKDKNSNKTDEESDEKKQHHVDYVDEPSSKAADNTINPEQSKKRRYKPK